jgi:hypothetical protein
LAAIRLDIDRAKKRLAQLRAEEYQVVLKVACRLCGVKAGQRCCKGCSSRETAAHAERRRDAE